MRAQIPTRLLTGTDEHGLKMAQAASQAGLTPKAYADEQAAKFEALCASLGVSYDRFIRTTDADHKTTAQDLWNRMADRGDLYLGKYSGWYSTRDEAYFDESEIVEGRAPTGNPVEWLEEETWFFRLTAYREALATALDQIKIEPKSARNKVLSMLDDLRDVSVSRTSFDWGIEVPGSPQHVMYVWVDALANYLTGADGAWPADVHIVGKDIIKFHCIYWPAFLLSAGLELPKKIFAHGFLLNDGVKMSKSLGNVVDPIAEVEKFGADAVRYFLLREITFGDDGSYSRVALVQRCNADLANGIGNLLSRTCALIVKKLDGQFVSEDAEYGMSAPEHELLRELFDITHKEVRPAFENLNFSYGLARWCEAVSLCDRYINTQKPWDASMEADRVREVLVCLMTALGELLEVIEPVMPHTVKEIDAYLSTWPLTKPPVFFPRLEE